MFIRDLARLYHRVWRGVFPSTLGRETWSFADLRIWSRVSQLNQFFISCWKFQYCCRLIFFHSSIPPVDRSISTCKLALLPNHTYLNHGNRPGSILRLCLMRIIAYATQPLFFFTLFTNFLLLNIYRISCIKMRPKYVNLLIVWFDILLLLNCTKFECRHVFFFTFWISTLHSVAWCLLI